VGPPRNGSMAEHGAMENTEHNLSIFLVNIAHLLKLRGCKTVGELLESGPLPDYPTDRANTMLQMLRSLDYIALRFLADTINNPKVMMADESLI
jgi:hypothetical protein